MIQMIREDIRTAFERDPAARSTWEVLTCYPGLHAIWLYRISHRLWSHGWFWLARWIMHVTRWMTGIEIHPGATIGRGFFIDHGMGIVVGETTDIGDGVTLYHGVTLGGTTWRKEKRHPTLQDGVIVGAGAKVLGAITIGKQSRIGSNSVVLRDVPAHATVVGIPGTVVGISEEVIQDGRINLDHHLLPDPVAEALKHMLKMVDDLSARIDEYHPDTNDEYAKQISADMEREHKELDRFFGGGGI
ncbi:MAG: serine O-acetyltransferase [Mariprofundales bacterium]|nr:serine O-acetyltransferase [Mariprofundales bacterium]